MPRLTICMLLVFLLPGSPGWTQRSSYDPAASRRSKPHDSFAEFALKQINPQNTAYGCQLAAARKLAVDETVKRIDFWTVMVTLSFLVLSFVILLHQHRERSRREIIAASFLSQYHNAWVDSSKQAEDTIRRHNELVNSKNRAAEADPRSQVPDGDLAQVGAAKPDPERDKKPKWAPAAAFAPNAKTIGNGTSGSDSMRKIKFSVPQSEVDLIAQISTLQQQLNASHDREKQLQKELNKTQRRVPSAQTRDASVPS